MSGAEARSALGQGDLAAARRLSAALPEAEARLILGLADAAEGRVSAGIAQLQAALAVRPTAEIAAQLARLLVLARRDGEARDAALRAEALGPQDALTFDTIGCVHTRLGDHARAATLFAPAVAAAPENSAFRYNLAAALGFLGRSEDARGQYEALLAAEPLNGRAHYALSLLARATPERNHVARLEAALAAGPDPDSALRIHYALAKEHEELGQAEPAFQHLAAANAAQKARLRYDFAQDAAIFDAIEAAFAGPLPAAPDLDGEAPIFVMGMPRTGTTLVDRMLSTHGQVHSAGELQAMPLAVKQAAGTRSRLILDPDTVRAAAAVPPATIGQLYARNAAPHRGEPPRCLDKLPANFLYAGFIARALPQASLVCLRRHPLDTVWSNYKNLFAVNSAYYSYSYDLIDTARYFVRFDRLMALWDGLLPGRILQLSYEALVADPETESRRLFGHCGLEWTPAVLSFHESTTPVATPSAAQVRRPVNSDAVARWKAHEAALTGARAVIEAAGIAV